MKERNIYQEREHEKKRIKLLKDTLIEYRDGNGNQPKFTVEEIGRFIGISGSMVKKLINDSCTKYSTAEKYLTKLGLGKK